MIRRQRDLAWRIGGPQGSGVDTAAGMFARACATGGLHLFGRREYYSNIMGRHSYYDVRVSRHALTCHRDTPDLLITFEPETLARHALAVVKGGGIIYDVDDADTPLERIAFLDERVQEDLRADLEAHGLPCSTAGLIAAARQRGIDTFAIPFDEIAHALARELRVPQTVADRTLNTIAVAASCALLHYDRAYLAKALAKVFPGRAQLIELNTLAVERTYEFVRHNLPADDFSFRLVPEPTRERRLLINGNQAVALGKLAAGMTFQTYYPISPATDESVYLEAHETFPTVGGEDGSVIIVQSEDILFNNEVYGLTKGQAAPTLPLGLQTKSLPEPSIQGAVNPLMLALASGYTWIGRGYAFHVRHLVGLIQKAIRHPGLAYLDVLQPCPTYNDLHSKGWFAGEDLAHGEGRVYEVEQAGYDPALPEGADAEMTFSKMTQFMAKAQEWGDRIPIGVLWEKRALPTFEQRIATRNPSYSSTPPARRIIANEHGHPTTDLRAILAELAIT